MSNGARINARPASLHGDARPARFVALLLLCLLAFAACFPARAQIFGFKDQLPASTFSRQALTNVDAAAWRTKLGISTDGTFTNYGLSLTNFSLRGSTFYGPTTNSGLTGSRVMVLDPSGVQTNSPVTAATLLFLDATSSVQSQLDAKASAANLTTVSNTVTGHTTDIVTASNAVVAVSNSVVTVSNSVTTLQGQLPGYATNYGASLTNATLRGATLIGPTTNSGLTGSRVMVLDANGVQTNSTVPAGTLLFLDVSSSVQGLLDAKATAANLTTVSNTVTGHTTDIATASNAILAVSNSVLVVSNGLLVVSNGVTTLSNTVATNVARLNGTNVLTGPNRFSAPVIATNTGNVFAGDGSGLTGISGGSSTPSIWKQAALFRTVTNDSLSGLSARNGITPIAGDRVLVMAQTNSVENGPYIAASGAWVRASDATTAYLTNGLAVPVTAGTVGAQESYVYSVAADATNWISAGSSLSWKCIATSYDGSKILAASWGGSLYTSENYGLTWTSRATSQQWHGVASSSNGVRLAAGVYGGAIYTSVDSGVTWTSQASGSATWSAIASSADGLTLLANAEDGTVKTSVDGGTNWTDRTSVAGSYGWRSASISADGTFMACGSMNNYAWFSYDGGVSWAVQTQLPVSVDSFAISADGMHQTAGAVAAGGGHVWTSTDHGTNWSEYNPSGGAKTWYGVSISGDGRTFCAGPYTGYFFTSVDNAVTWTTNSVPGSVGWYKTAVNYDGTLIAGSELASAQLHIRRPVWSFTSLTANSALLNGTNVFSGTNRFTAPVIATNTGSVFAGDGSGLTGVTPTLWSSPTNIYIATVANASNLTNNGDFAAGTYLAKFTCPALRSNSIVTVVYSILRTNGNAAAANINFYVGPNTNYVGTLSGAAGTAVGLATSVGTLALMQNAGSLTSQIQGASVSGVFIPKATNFVDTSAPFEMYFNTAASGVHTNLMIYGFRVRNID